MTESAAYESEVLDALRLSLTRGLGPIAQTRLRNRFGSLGGIFRASRDELLQVEGIGPKLAAEIIGQRRSDEVQEEFEACRELGVTLLLIDDPEYPDALREIPDPPQLLYVRGHVVPSDRLSIGIVGSRRCTLYGRQQAERFARELASTGITIVSGLARGIDSCAHRGAMEADGRTLAVLASGVASIYPPEHETLAEEVMSHGALVSESCLRQAPMPGLFPQRNRIISGLCQGVIIVEASRNSGALHTARHAYEQGREVFAVPGRLDSVASEGCHDLICDGAQLVRHVDDVLETLGPLAQPARSPDGQTVLTPRELNLNDQERAVLDSIPLEPGTVDELLRISELDDARVLATLTVLEMKRLIRRLPGGYVVRDPH